MQAFTIEARHRHVWALVVSGLLECLVDINSSFWNFSKVWTHSEFPNEPGAPIADTPEQAMASPAKPSPTNDHGDTGPPIPDPAPPFTRITIHVYIHLILSDLNLYTH